MRLAIRSAVLTAACLLTTSAADAAATDMNRSRGTADLSWWTRTPIVGPKSDKIGGSTLQVQFSANLDPLPDATKPLLSVAMKGVVVEAVWPDDKTIDLVLVESKAKDGTFKVEHTLAPHVTLFIDAFGFKLTYDYDANALINYVPGSAWNYLGTGTTTFEPWAFSKYAIVKVQGPPLANAQLFSMPLPGTGGSNPPLTGTIAFNATTSPTFNYATTEVVLQGGDALTKDGAHWTIPTTDADFLDVSTQVKGKISYTGTLLGRPTVTITKIGDFTLPFPLTLDIAAAGVELPYASGEAPIDVTFPATKIHIPLPNVKAAKSLDLGSSVIGQEVKKAAKVDNTGELDAVLALKSSDPQFKVSPTKNMKPKEKLDLEVVFTPASEGPQSAEITVTSNDPNEPVQIIKVTGMGTKPAAPPPPASEPADDDDDEGFGPRADNGCGCRTAPSPSGYAALGGVGIALATLLRRRRR
jgi:MYXO-CTERM domain-containing protein